MSKIAENKRRKQEAILEAAQKIFLSEGYILANMDKIAELAGVTKQTVYRYFPSKTELFKATLSYMGEKNHQAFFRHLNNPDNQEALNNFAIGFVTAHLSESHLATYRLLITECAKEPDIISYFLSHGKEDTTDQLVEFFTERLKVKHPEVSIRLWTAMLLSLRENSLFGATKASESEIEAHAKEATRWLLSNI